MTEREKLIKEVAHVIRTCQFPSDNPMGLGDDGADAMAKAICKRFATPVARLDREKVAKVLEKHERDCYNKQVHASFYNIADALITAGESIFEGKG